MIIKYCCFYVETVNLTPKYFEVFWQNWFWKQVDVNGTKFLNKSGKQRANNQQKGKKKEEEVISSDEIVIKLEEDN